MIARKKRIPTIEIGVGSGNSIKNIDRPLILTEKLKEINVKYVVVLNTYMYIT